MRLTELNPRWCNQADAPPGSKQGVTFDCPCCRQIRLGVWFDVPICGAEPVDIARIVKAMDCENPEYQEELHETHLTLKLWRREGDSFENLTLTPSVDASGFGHWHGWVKNGECV